MAENVVDLTKLRANLKKMTKGARIYNEKVMALKAKREAINAAPEQSVQSNVNMNGSTIP